MNYFSLFREIFEKPEALEGVRVVDISQIVLGPALTDFLAEFGAEVIKIELPDVGDVVRYVSPEFFLYNNLSPVFEEQNHNKYHVAIDLRKPEGKELFFRLVKKSDVVVENFRPGTTDIWEIGYRKLVKIKPDIIYLAASGFGQWGKNSKRVSHDPVAQVESGLMAITGHPSREPVVKSGAWIFDFSASIMGAIAVVAALIYRNKTGKGQFIDLSQVETAIRWMDWTWVYVGLTGKDRKRVGNRDLAIAPSDVVKAKNGFIAITAFTKEEYEALCKAMDREDLLKYSDELERLKPKVWETVNEALNEWAKEKSVEEIEEFSREYGFAASRVLTARDAYKSEHLRERRTIWIFEDHIYGEVAEVQAVKLSETPGRMKWTARPLGIDNEFALKTIVGLNDEEILKLYEKEVIGKWSKAKCTQPPDGWKGEGLFY